MVQILAPSVTTCETRGMFRGQGALSASTRGLRAPSLPPPASLSSKEADSGAQDLRFPCELGWYKELRPR